MSQIPELRGVVFDIDGTLGNTLDVVFAGFHAALAACGLALSEEEILHHFGPTEEGILRRLVPADQAEHAIEVYHRTYEIAHAQVPNPFEGIPDVLSLLKRRGIHLGIASGKGRFGAEVTLKQFGIRGHFDAVETGSDESFVKPDLLRRVIAHWKIPAEKVAYVGDVPWDVDAAREVGAHAIGAAWDERADVEGLRAKKPLALFTSAEEFADWIRVGLPIPA